MGDEGGGPHAPLAGAPRRLLGGPGAPPRRQGHLDETQADIAAAGLVAPIVGHVGDGNFHVLPLIDTDDPAEVEAAKAFVERLVLRALAMEGTCTGEHGVGQMKMKYLEAEHGPEALDLMRVLKRAVDPANIMNPGKVVAL